MHSIKCYSKYNMDLTIYCVFSVLLSVTANVYPNIPNQHVPNYVNYRQYVHGMYHQPEKYPQMAIYGDRFDSHGSYKFNPHIIPYCQTINHYICCQTKYTYICQPEQNAQVSDTTNTDSGETDHTIVTTTVLPDSTILITLENVETTGIVEGTDTNGGDLTAEYKISPFPDTTVTSDSTAITAVTNITDGIIDIAAPTSSELTTEAVISISESTQTSTISKTSGTNSAKEANSTSGTTYMGSGDDETTKYEEKTIDTSTISTDVDTDSEGSGSGNPIDMESGDDEITIEYEGSGITDSTITTRISVLTTKGSGEVTDMEDGDGKITREYEGSGITLSTVSTTHTILTTTMKSLITDTEETIDIDETSSEPTTLTSVSNTSPTEITGSGTGITDVVTDPDMEAGSGDSEIRTEYEGSTFGSTTKSAITTDISEIRDTMDPDLEGSATDTDSSGDGVSDDPFMFTNKNIEPPDVA